MSQGGSPDKHGLWPLTHLSSNSGIPTVSVTLPLSDPEFPHNENERIMSSCGFVMMMP